MTGSRREIALLTNPAAGRGRGRALRAAALAQVTDHIDHARDQSSSSTMGDGQYTEPPAAGDGA